MLGAVLAVAILIWAKTTGHPWEALGFGRPASWIRTIAGGAALGIGLKLFTKAFWLPLLGAPSTNTTYQGLVGDPAMLAQLIFVSIVIGGIGEEIFWRGFLFDRFRRLVGNGTVATVGIVIVTALLFAGAHYFDQGLPGVEQALVTGLAFGTLFAMTGRLWPVMVAHAAYDLLAVAIIYAGWEQTIAHLIFK